jgi:hypothetical protein
MLDPQPLPTPAREMISVDFSAYLLGAYEQPFGDE